MAQVLQSALHNVGIVLNSVNVSASLLLDNVRQSKLANLPKLAVNPSEFQFHPLAFLDFVL